MTIYIYLKNHGFINLVTLCSTVMLIKTIYLVQHTIIEYSVSGFFFQMSPVAISLDVLKIT